MSLLWIWIGALVLYGVFELWYGNWSGPLSRKEIDDYMARIEAGSENLDPQRRATVRRFLEADDGGEFFMANLVRFPSEPVTDPRTGEPRPAAQVLRGYTDRFMPALLRRAGHPVFVGRAAGGYVEHWGVEPDPGWSMVGVLRYRSRRDMIELATAPAFAPAHAFKIAAMSHTLAFPLAPGFSVLGPRVWLALLLGLLAALGQLSLGGS
jgi:hypothetical protein